MIPSARLVVDYTDFELQSDQTLLEPYWQILFADEEGAAYAVFMDRSLSQPAAINTAMLMDRVTDVLLPRTVSSAELAPWTYITEDLPARADIMKDVCSIVWCQETKHWYVLWNDIMLEFAADDDLTLVRAEQIFG